jgi:cytochrome b
MNTTVRNEHSVKVWDPLLRLLHWTLAGSIAVTFLTGEEALNMHIWAGLAALGVVATRIVWGLVGPRHARFGDFIPTPGEVVRHLRQMFGGQPAHYAGHNPAAGAMVIVLLLMVLGVVASGLLGLTGTGGGEFAEELHEGLAWALLLLIGLHVGGVIVSSLVEHQNLALGMLTGRKRVTS